MFHPFLGFYVASSDIGGYGTMDSPKKYCGECGREKSDIVQRLEFWTDNVSYIVKESRENIRADMVDAVKEIERLRANQCKCP
jgi:hypothetical protein